MLKNFKKTSKNRFAEKFQKNRKIEKMDTWTLCQTDEDQAANDRFLGRIADNLHEYYDAEAYDADCDTDETANCDECTKQKVAWQICDGSGCCRKLCLGLGTCARARQSWCEHCRMKFDILPPSSSGTRIQEEINSKKPTTFHYPDAIIQKAKRAHVHPSRIETEIIKRAL